MKILKPGKNYPKYSDEPEDIHVLDDPEYVGKYILQGPDVSGGRLGRMSTPSEELIIEQEEKRLRNSSRVYFVQAGVDGPIKIGHSRKLHDRLRKLQLSSPVELTLLHTEPGGEDREQELHERFRDSRLHGEWFTYSKDIQEYLHESGR